MRNIGLKLLLDRREARIRGNANRCSARGLRVNANFLQMWPVTLWILAAQAGREGGNRAVSHEPSLTQVLPALCTPVTYIVLGLLWPPLTAGEGEKGRQDDKGLWPEGTRPRKNRLNLGPLQCSHG